MSSISELNKRLPVDSVTDAMVEIADTVVDTVQRVGHAVGDQLPDSVPAPIHDAVADGVIKGRRLLDRVPLERVRHHVPGVSASKPRSRKRELILVGSLVVVIGSFLLWRRRVRDQATVVPDDWDTSDLTRSVA